MHPAILHPRRSQFRPRRGFTHPDARLLAEVGESQLEARIAPRLSLVYGTALPLASFAKATEAKEGGSHGRSL
jgi:hypothetical protein